MHKFSLKLARAFSMLQINYTISKLGKLGSIWNNQQAEQPSQLIRS